MKLRTARKWLATAIACGAVLSAVTSSNAAVYTWSYSDALNSGGGTLTTGMAVPNPTGFPPPTSGFLITDITGTFDGQSITSLAPVNSGVGGILNDNILYPTSTPLLDDAGFAFTAGAAFDILAGITVQGQFTGFYDLFGVAGGEGSFTITPAVPLPATLPLFATGLGALGLLGWRRKRRAQPVA